PGPRTLLLCRPRVLAIVPPPSSSTEEPLPEVVPVLGVWVKGALVVIAAGLVAVFVIAWRLNPYREDGTPLRQETPRQLWMPPCPFHAVTGVPCPSCGMTTSFSLLIHGDVLNSLRANAVGTLLALFCLGVIPWAVLSVARGRSLFVRSLDRALLVVVGGLM